jgi:riboflavin synthase
METPEGWKLSSGQSIAVDGVCSTVVEVGAGVFMVEYMRETMAKTTAGNYQEGSKVNLERSLTLQDFIDGGLVSGHVDATGAIEEIVILGETKEMVISFSAELKKYITPKGSIVVNGVSLTVVDTQGNSFRVALIPYTLEYTNLALLEEGSLVNIEVDMLARYVVNALAQK